MLQKEQLDLQKRMMNIKNYKFEGNCVRCI